MIATVRVDLGNKSATVVADGKWEGTWSGVTRTTTGEHIAVDGWQFAPDSTWQPDVDGGTREVVR